MILGGFQNSVSNKVFGFTGHYNITQYSQLNSFDNHIAASSQVVKDVESQQFVSHVDAYAYLAGLIKTNETVEGVVFKGVEEKYVNGTFKNFLIKGSFYNKPEKGYSKEVIISQRIADRLRVEVGDDMLIYFVKNPPRYRKIKVCGIFKTDLEDFDRQVIVGDIDLVRRINGWPDTVVGGYEVFLHDVNRIDELHEKMFDLLSYDLYPVSIKHRFQQIFDWLDLLPRNVNLLIAIITIVSCFNMISVLLILIMERTRMIGVLQAIGASRKLIRRVFSYNGMILTLKGVLLGNILALSIALLQDQLHLITLDPVNYYVSYVPVEWNFNGIIGINLLTLMIVFLSLRIPTAVISRIKPVRAIRFD